MELWNAILSTAQFADIDGNVVVGDEFTFASEVVTRKRPLEPSRLRMPSLSAGTAMIRLRSMMQCGEVDIILCLKDQTNDEIVWQS